MTLRGIPQRTAYFTPLGFLDNRSHKLLYFISVDFLIFVIPAQTGLEQLQNTTTNIVAFSFFFNQFIKNSRVGFIELVHARNHSLSTEKIALTGKLSTTLEIKFLTRSSKRKSAMRLLCFVINQFPLYLLSGYCRSSSLLFSSARHLSDFLRSHASHGLSITLLLLIAST